MNQNLWEACIAILESEMRSCQRFSEGQNSSADEGTEFPDG